MLTLALVLGFGAPQVQCPGVPEHADGGHFLAGPFMGHAGPGRDLPAPPLASELMLGAAEQRILEAAVRSPSQVDARSYAMFFARALDTHGGPALRLLEGISSTHHAEVERLAAQSARAIGGARSRFWTAALVSRRSFADSCPLPADVDGACTLEAPDERVRGFCGDHTAVRRVAVTRSAVELGEAQAWRELALAALTELQRTDAQENWERQQMVGWLRLDAATPNYEGIFAVSYPRAIRLPTFSDERPQPGEHARLEAVQLTCSADRFNEFLAAFRDRSRVFDEAHSKISGLGGAPGLVSTLRSYRAYIALDIEFNIERLDEASYRVKQDRPDEFGFRHCDHKNFLRGTAYAALEGCLERGPATPYGSAIDQACWAEMSQWDAEAYPWLSEIFAEGATTPRMVREGLRTQSLVPR